VNKCFGKYEFFVDMAKSFSAEADSCIGAMKEARLQNNTGAVRDAAHRLKNTVMYLGSGSAMCAIVEVENAAKSGDLLALDNALQQLELCIENLKQSLADHCQR
jgi:HPt (histidine-containing phosphotransfer) domain-containing protein